MPLHRAILFATALALVTACGDPTAVSDGVLTAQHRSGLLELRNRSSTPVHYFVAERETLALIDWIPCVGATCPSVAARAQVVVPDSRIIGFKPGAREAVLYWWRAVQDASGVLRPDSLRSLIVPLQ